MKSDVEALLAKGRSRYVEDWSKSSTSFEAQGFYQWAANIMGTRPTILEVGTGVGSGTLALSKIAQVVVGIEENPECLQATHDRLVREGVNVSLVRRAKLEFGDSEYEQTFAPIDAALPAGGVLLVEGDLLGRGEQVMDLELTNWLLRHKFDGIACWLIGTHVTRAQSATFGGAFDAQQYRLITQNHVYELADRLLVSGGVLHMIDRGEALSDDAIREDLVRSHRDQASTTSLQVNPEPASMAIGLAEDGINMQVSRPLSGRTGKVGEVHAQSVIAVKPDEVTAGSSDAPDAL